MKNILILLSALCLLTACENTKPRAKKIIARITYYSQWEDKFGAKTACGGHAQEGVTVAALPSHPFGQLVAIPKLAGLVGDGTFVVQDRGSAVTQMKASWGTTEVFDVFLSGSKEECERRMIELTLRVGYYTEAWVF